MANDDEITARGGLLPVGYPSGNYRKTPYQVTTGGTAHNFFIGQPVDLDSNGRVAAVAPGDETLLLGSIVGFLDTNQAGLPTAMTDLTQGAYLPGDKDGYVLVADDPNQYFQIQEDTGGSALTQSNIGNTAAFVWRSTSGNTTTGYSTAELDRSDVAADNSGSLKIVGLIDRMNSDGTRNAFGDYGKLMVQIHNHRNAGAPNVNSAV